MVAEQHQTQHTMKLNKNQLKKLLENAYGFFDRGVKSIVLLLDHMHDNGFVLRSTNGYAYSYVWNAYISDDSVTFICADDPSARDTFVVLVEATTLLDLVQE